MVHTLPPWTSKYKMLKIFGQIDSGELAARLGALSLQDRRGNLVWCDDFESPVTKWTHTATGTGASVALSADYSTLGSQSMKITTSASTAESSLISRYFTLPPQTRIGCEFMCMPVDSKMVCTLIMNGYDGSNFYDPRVRVNFATDVVQYYHITEGWKTIDSDLKFYDGIKTWLFVKLVFDWDTKKYVRLMVGKEEYDLSAQSIKSSGSGAEPLLSLEIWATPSENASHIIYLDNVVLTQNEN